MVCTNSAGLKSDIERPFIKVKIEDEIEKGSLLFFVFSLQKSVEETRSLCAIESQAND
jgi:hypothetical protein